MAYCIYLRKSRSDEELEAMGEDTLERHEKALISLAQKKQLPVTEIYREIVSGETISARPKMQQLINEVEQGAWQGVLVMEVERLARGDTIDQGIVAQAFKYTKTLIITPNKTYDPNNEYDEEYFEFGLFMSRREYKTINRRLQRGRLTSINEGKYVGNKAPYGYERVKLEREKGYTLRPLEEEAKIVKLIFEMFTQDNIGSTNIASHLNGLGVPTASGLRWTTQTITLILKNPVYCGKIKWGARAEIKKVVNGEIVKSRPRKALNDTLIVDGLHEALVSEAAREIVLTKLKDNPLNGIAVCATVKNPLVGLVFCGMCGGRMNRRDYKKRAKDTLLCANSQCPNISSDLDLVEKSMLQTLEKYLLEMKADFKKQNAQVATTGRHKAELATLNAEQTKVKKQLNSLYELLEQGVYSKEIFLERSLVLNDKTLALEKSIAETESKIDEVMQKKKAQDDIIPRFENVLKTYGQCETAKEKNDLLKTVVDKSVYTKTVNGRWTGDPANFSLVVNPRL